MDPNATLSILIDAAIEGDADLVREVARGLSEWIRGGGFPPSDPRGTN